jgi:hypothetical protein
MRRITLLLFLILLLAAVAVWWVKFGDWLAHTHRSSGV